MPNDDGWDQERMLLTIPGGIAMKDRGGIKLGFLFFLIIAAILLLASFLGID